MNDDWMRVAITYSLWVGHPFAVCRAWWVLLSSEGAFSCAPTLEDAFARHVNLKDLGEKDEDGWEIKDHAVYLLR